MPSGAAFPRGSSGAVALEPDAAKERRRREEDVLFGSTGTGSAKPSKKKKDDTTTASSSSSSFEALSRLVVKTGGKGKRTKVVPLTFASYAEGVSVLGVVRSVSDRGHALISLPGALVGHAVVEQHRVRAGAVVRCAVLSTRREKRHTSGAGAKRIEVTLDVKVVQRGLKLDDLTSGRVPHLAGSVISLEQRGYLVDVGVKGVTGFLPKANCEEVLEPRSLIECKVVKVDGETGVIRLDATREAVAKAQCCAGSSSSSTWSFNTLVAGQRVRAQVQRQLENGLVTRFLGDFAGGMENDHAVANADFVDARVLMVDRAAKTVRLTTLQHLVDLMPVRLPAIGATLKGRVETIYDKVGLLVRTDEGQGCFVHVSRLNKKIAVVEDGGGALTEKNNNSEVWPAVGAEATCRVIGSAALEGWALGSMSEATLNPAVALTKSELRPGTVVEATVLQTGAFGAKVRISETLRGVVTNAHLPKKKVQAKDVLACRVLTVDAGKIALTAKAALVRDPSQVLTSFEDAARSVGASFTGFVSALDGHRGLSVTFYGGCYGVVPTSSLKARGVDDVRSAYSLGDVVRCVLRRTLAKGHQKRKDKEEKTTTKTHLILTLDDNNTNTNNNDGGPTPKTTLAIEVGLVTEARIVEILAPPNKAASALVRLLGGDEEDDAASSGIVASLSAAAASDHAKNGLQLLRAYSRSGRTLPVVVTDLARPGRLAEVSAAPLLVSTARVDDFPTVLTLGAECVGHVNAVESYGCFVKFPNGLSGLVPRRNVCADHEALDQALAVGDAVRCRVDRLDEKKRPTLACLFDDGAAYAASALADQAKLQTLLSPSDKKEKKKRRVEEEEEEEEEVALPLGHAADAVVVSKQADGALRLKVATAAEGDACTLVCPASQALTCSVGDVVKVRALCLAPGGLLIECTMRPYIVRGGRAKKRKAAAALAGSVRVRAVRLFPAHPSMALVVVEESGALAVLSCAGHASRLASSRLPAALEEADGVYFKTDAAGEPFAVDGLVPTDHHYTTEEEASPYAHLPTLGFQSHPANDSRSSPVVVSSSDEGPPSKKTKTKKKRVVKLEATDVDALEAGDMVHCRVLHVSSESVQLSVREISSSGAGASSSSSSKRAVKAQLHLCDVEDAAAVAEALIGAVDEEDEGDDSDGGNNNGSLNIIIPEAFKALTKGSVLRCRLVGKVTSPKVALLSVGVGSTKTTTRQVLFDEKWPSEGAVEATVVGRTAAAYYKVALSPSLKATLSVVDVANTMFDGMVAATVDRSEAFLQSAANAAWAQALDLPIGGRVLVTKTPRGATTWVAQDGRPRKVKPGDVVVGRRQQSTAGRKKNLFALDVDLPGLAKRGECCVTEQRDEREWTDLNDNNNNNNNNNNNTKPLEEEKEGALCVVVVVLALPSSDDQGLKVPVSLRRSRLFAEDMEEDTVEPGRIKPGFVLNADPKKGVFVRLTRSVVGRVLLKDLADGYVADVARAFPRGKLVAPLVVSLSPKGAELSMRSKLIERDARRSSKWGDRLAVGMKVTGLVTRVEAFGVFVKIDDAPAGFEAGLAHKSEIADDFVKDVADRFQKGDRVKALVLHVEEPADGGTRHRLRLGLKPSYFNAADAEVVVPEGDDDDDDDDDEAMDDAQARVDAMLAADSDDEDGDDDDEEEEDDDEEEEAEADDDEDAESDSHSSESDVEMGGTSNAVPVALVSGGQKRTLAWDDNDDDDDESSMESSMEQEDAEAGEASAYARESELAADGAARSRADFERLVVGAPDDGKLWIAFMNHMVRDKGIAAARAVSMKALGTINYRREKERFDVWCSLAELEADHGTKKSFDEAVSKASKACEAQALFVRVAELLDARGDAAGAEAMFRRAEKRSKRAEAVRAETWAKHWRSRLRADDAAGAAAVLARAMQAAADPARDHVALRVQFAAAELDVGAAERGRTLFDALVAENPKRLDIWQVYATKALKHLGVPAARAVYEAAAQAPLAPKAMQRALKAFADFEKRHGDDKTRARVRDLARAYVNAKLQDDDDDDL